MKSNKYLYNIICITFLSYVLLFTVIYVLKFNNVNLKSLYLENGFINMDSFTSTDVEFLDYSFSIPDNYTYEVNDNVLMITDSSTWAANIQIIDKKYSDILLIKKNIKYRLEEYGYAVNNMYEINYKNNNFLVVEIVGAKTRRMLFYAKLNNSNTYVIEFISNLDSIDYTIVDNVIPVLNSIKE